MVRVTWVVCVVRVQDACFSPDNERGKRYAR